MEAGSGKRRLTANMPSLLRGQSSRALERRCPAQCPTSLQGGLPQASSVSRAGGSSGSAAPLAPLAPPPLMLVVDKNPEAAACAAGLLRARHAERADVRTPPAPCSARAMGIRWSAGETELGCSARVTSEFLEDGNAYVAFASLVALAWCAMLFCFKLLRPDPNCRNMAMHTMLLPLTSSMHGKRLLAVGKAQLLVSTSPGRRSVASSAGRLCAKVSLCLRGRRLHWRGVWAVGQQQVQPAACSGRVPRGGRGRQRRKPLHAGVVGFGRRVLAGGLARRALLLKRLPIAQDGSALSEVCHPRATRGDRTTGKRNTAADSHILSGCFRIVSG